MLLLIATLLGMVSDLLETACLWLVLIAEITTYAALATMASKDPERSALRWIPGLNRIRLVREAGFGRFWNVLWLPWYLDVLGAAFQLLTPQLDGAHTTPEEWEILLAAGFLASSLLLSIAVTQSLAYRRRHSRFLVLLSTLTPAASLLWMAGHVPTQPLRPAPSRSLRRRLIALTVVALYALVPWSFPAYVAAAGSMAPTILSLEGRRDRIIASRLTYAFREPERFDVIVWRRGTGAYAHRIVGMPGERLAIANGDLYRHTDPDAEATSTGWEVVTKPPAVQEQLWRTVIAWDTTTADSDEYPLENWEPISGTLRLDHAWVTARTGCSARYPNTGQSVFNGFQDGYPRELVASIDVPANPSIGHSIVGDLRLTLQVTPSAETRTIDLGIETQTQSIHFELAGPSSTHGSTMRRKRVRELEDSVSALPFGTVLDTRPHLLEAEVCDGIARLRVGADHLQFDLDRRGGVFTPGQAATKRRVTLGCVLRHRWCRRARESDRRRSRHPLSARRPRDVRDPGQVHHTGRALSDPRGQPPELPRQPRIGDERGHRSRDRNRTSG